MILSPLALRHHLLTSAMPVCTCQGFWHIGSLCQQHKFPPTCLLCVLLLTKSQSSAPRSQTPFTFFMSCIHVPSHSLHSPVSGEIRTCDLQLSSSLCHLDLSFLPSHLVFRFLTLSAQAPAEAPLRKNRGMDVRFDPKQEVTGKVLSLSAHTRALEMSHTGNPVSHGICEGRRYNLVSTRDYRC